MAGETTTATPDEELEDEQDGTPEGEPADTAEPEQPADQPAAEPESPYTQAEYTRSQQTISSIRDKLGLDKKATRQQVLDAFDAALEARQATGADEEDEEEDPRVTEANERAWNAELQLATAIYGEEFTGSMTEVINVARTTNDPRELATAFAAFAMDYGATLAGAAPAAAEAEDEPDEGESASLDIGPSEGDRGPSARQAAEQPARRRDTGVVGAIRGIFQEAGVYDSRQR